MRRSVRTALVSAVLAAASSLDPSAAAILDRVGVYVDGWYASTRGFGRIDGPGTGSRYDLAEDAGLRSRVVAYEAGAWFHPVGRHRVRVAAMSLSEDRSESLPRSLSFGGAPEPAGTAVRASFDLRLAEAQYAWSFVNMDIVNVAVIAGADGFDARNRMELSGARPDASLRSAVPVAGLTFQAQPIGFVRIYGEAVYGVGIFATDATLRDVRVRAEFYVAHFFGLGVGYRDFRLRADDPGEGLADARIKGFQGYLLFRF